MPGMAERRSGTDIEKCTFIDSFPAKALRTRKDAIDPVSLRLCESFATLRENCGAKALRWVLALTVALSRFPDVR